MKFRPALLATLLSSISFASLAAVEIVDPFARATPPHAPNSAAFMTLANSGDDAVALVSASTPAAGKVELHNHVMHDGMMKMRQVEKIDIPANGNAVLKPGGLHVMLFDLAEPLKEGNTLPLTLTFSDGTEITETIPVRMVMSGAKMKQNHENAH